MKFAVIILRHLIHSPDFLCSINFLPTFIKANQSSMSFLVIQEISEALYTAANKLIHGETEFT